MLSNEKVGTKYLKKYGNDFKTMRLKANISQLEVAQEIECSQAVISHIECGYMLPPLHIEKAMLELYKKKGVIKNEKIYR